MSARPDNLQYRKGLSSFRKALSCTRERNGRVKAREIRVAKHQKINRVISAGSPQLIAPRRLFNSTPIRISNETYEMTSSDLVAHWEVPLHDRVHKIEFEHGTTTGKRVIRVDGNEILRREWMFKLVGNEIFTVGTVKCEITVDSVGAFSYSYGLKVNGKSYKKFTETQSKALKTWIVNFDSEIFRVVLEKDTLDVWANGKKLDATGEFVDDGTETHFTLGNWPAYIKAATSGNRREGIIHHLIVDDKIVPPAQE